MSNANKRKGVKFETDLAKRFREAGFDTQRAWGSDGRALGHTTQTDLVINGLSIQAKKGYNQPTLKLFDMMKGADVVIWECSDRRKNPYGPYVFMEVETFMKLLSSGEPTHE